MDEKRIKYYWTIFFSVVLIGFSCGQDSYKLMVRTSHYNNKLILGADNYFSILGMQDKPISEDQISAFLCTTYQYLYKKEPIPLEITKGNGEFRLHPDSLGIVEFRVKIKGQIEKVRVDIEPLRAICSVAGKINGKLSIQELTAQMGIIAYMDMEGMNGRCNVKSYELIRIGADGVVSKFKNQGGRFEETAQEIIKKAAKGDLYIFRDLDYYCPSTTIQRAEDMIFEIK